MKESIIYLNNLNIKNEKIVIACSGGPDSMALLSMMKKNNFNIICAHVNHNVRKESDDEYIFVENYCKKNDIIFEGMKISKYKNNRFTEAEARIIRYNFFKQIISKYNSKILMTAHHGDDLIETIIMKINRGSSINGYKGFSIMSDFDGYKIIRPLIFYTKKEIKEYVENNNIPYVTDKSNETKKYYRNRIRLEILPILKKENCNINKKYLEYSEKIEEATNFIQRETNKAFNEVYKNNILNLTIFKEKDDFLQEKILEKILFSIYKEDIYLITKKHINEIIKIIKSNNKQVLFPKNITIKKEYDKLIFNYEKQKNEYNYIFNECISINGDEIKTIEDVDIKSNYIIKLNSKEIKLPLHIRTRQTGDKIYVKHLTGSKKVNDIFIDNKIENNKRNSWPLLIDDNNNILWIPGIKKSKYDCSKERKYDIIIKYIKKGEKK